MEEKEGQSAKREGQLFCEMFKTSPIGIALEDLQGWPLFANPALCSMLGFSEEEMRSKHCVEFSPPEDAKKDWALFELLRKGLIDSYHIEKRFFRRDGSLVWGSLSISLWNGRPSPLVIAMVEDITQNKKAEEAFCASEERLARANERLRLAIEAGSVGGWDYDVKSGEVVFFGKAHDQLGMSTDETSGSRQQFWDHIHEDDREHLQHAMRVAREKHEAFNEDFRVVWRDGTVRWLRSRGQYYYSGDGQPERLLGISVDITDSKQAEQALRDSDQRFRLAAQIGKMYSFEWDVTTDVVVRCPERVNVLGATGPLRSSHRQFVDTIYPEDRQKFIAIIAGLAPENPTAEVIFRVRGPDGGLLWLKSSGRAFFDGQRRMLRVIGMVADITDLKRAEEALSDMTRKLIEAHEEERTRIARELHDDICQRLAVLIMNLDRLGAADRTSPVEFREAIVKAREDASNVALDIQALSHGLHSSKLEYFGLANAAASYCSELADQHNVEIHLQSEDIPNDLSREITLCLFRVLQEAVQNAIKHSHSQRFDVSFRRTPSEMICLTVHDSGIGFDPGEAIKGEGLGLISMKERMKLVGGELSIESQPGKGTTIGASVPRLAKRLNNLRLATS
jgi:PAS domain S-box-containing protein